jgi:hypothetical protein
MRDVDHLLQILLRQPYADARPVRIGVIWPCVDRRISRNLPLCGAGDRASLQTAEAAQEVTRSAENALLDEHSAGTLSFA